MEETTQRVSPEKLNNFISDLFASAGLDEPHATTVSQALIEASLRGVDSHGIIRTQPYLRNIEKGGFNSSPKIEINRLNQAVLEVDADDGPGQSATMQAMDEAIDVALENGVALATVKNSNHFGTGAFYTQRAAQEDCIGIVMANSGSNVVPFGGTEPYFGTNPIAYSIPTTEDYHITLDMATSQVAKGKVTVAAQQGKSIPEQWAVDKDGNPTTDPNDVSAMRPLGGPKGYGLGLLADVCAGVLSDMGLSPQVASVSDDFAEPQQIGHFVGVIDISSFIGLEGYYNYIDSMITDLQESPTQEGVNEIKLPGQIEAETRTEREANGIPVEEDEYQRLSEFADKYSLSVPAPLSN